MNKTRRISTYEALLSQAAERQGVKIDRIGSSLMIFKKNGKEMLVRKSMPDLNGFIATKVTNDKILAKQVMANLGIPVPGGCKEKNAKKVLEMIKKKELHYPLVVKPVDGVMGIAVTVDIRKEKWLRRAIEEVHKFNRHSKGCLGNFMVEEYITGNDYRFLVLDGKVLTVMRREPAYVIGDGRKNLGQLIDTYNNQPDIALDRPLCPIVRDYELERNLERLHLTEKFVPKKRQKVVLRKNANISTGGRSFECANKAAPEYKALAIKIAKAFHLRFCAVDLIAPDINKFDKYFVIEVNATPGFDIHEFPYRGKPFPVAKHLMRAMFK